ncbi:MAG: hypothetical protein SH850_24690 [Planctomycetaceae bacterium]|nr:hypothetical protein [Planctomycetaceae bacterium]
MNVILLRLMLFAMIIVAPVAIAAWVGSRVRSPLVAFVIAWMLTPVLTGLNVVLMIPAIRLASPPNNDGTGVIMLPFLGLVTGLFAGIAAAVLSSRRKITSSSTDATIGKEF